MSSSKWEVREVIVCSTDCEASSPSNNDDDDDDFVTDQDQNNLNLHDSQTDWHAYDDLGKQNDHVIHPHAPQDSDSFQSYFEDNDDEDGIGNDDEIGIHRNANKGWWQEPIVVGYAFGPKKMSTMGVVMAEASRTQVIHEEEEEDEDDDEEQVGADDQSEVEEEYKYGGVEDLTGPEELFYGEESSLLQEDKSYMQPTSAADPAIVDTDSSLAHPEGCASGTLRSQTSMVAAATATTATAAITSPPPSPLTTAALKGLESKHNDTNKHHTIISLGNSNDTDLKHIVRYFRSSCSSAAASMSETTVSTPTTAVTCHTVTTTATTGTASTVCQNQKISSRTKTSTPSAQSTATASSPPVPVRISFVPLDPDVPLEEQHGGRPLDLILHKLTEDILTRSLQQRQKINHVTNNNTHNHSNRTMNEEARTAGSDQTNIMSKNDSYSMPGTTPAIDAANARVQRLLDYPKRINPRCCLVDDPTNVQTLMSRSDIAHVLRTCLRNVTSASGIPVVAPKFYVVQDQQQQQQQQSQPLPGAPMNVSAMSSPSATERLSKALREAELSPPLIVKPLIAAGTKQSHYMTIVLKESALAKIPNNSIVQEYANHNAILYKVYVMGGDENVHVYQRPSLPDLPTSTRSCDSTDEERTESPFSVDMVEFDSQRPYPRVQDFGIISPPPSKSDSAGDFFRNNDNDSIIHATKQGSDSGVNDKNSDHQKVTREEVLPIVHALKEAFGLDLFGFDILVQDESLSKERSEEEVTSSKEGKKTRQWLVVDVNYFPSYKEVPNFPSLLARYLSQRVLERRRLQRKKEKGMMKKIKKTKQIEDKKRNEKKKNERI